ncbi:MAG: hypothetical protein K5647_03255, partial [Clostridiales bacterium]|nr:hypothetical protein [Clostridiales bacterium]
MASNVLEWQKSIFAAMSLDELFKTGAQATENLMLSLGTLGLENDNVDSAVGIFVEMFVSCVKLGFNTDSLSQLQTQFINKVLPEQLKSAAIDWGSGVVLSITQEDYDAVNLYNVLLQNQVGDPRTIGTSALKLLLSAAYIDGELDDDIAEKIDSIFGMVLTGLFFESGYESVPVPKKKLTGLEAKVFDYMSRQKDFQIIREREFSTAIPGASASEVKSAINSLCEKGILYYTEAFAEFLDLNGYHLNVQPEDVELDLTGINGGSSKSPKKSTVKANNKAEDTKAGKKEKKIKTITNPVISETIAQEDTRVVINGKISILVPRGMTYSTDKNEIGQQRSFVFIKEERNAYYDESNGPLGL